MTEHIQSKLIDILKHHSTRERIPDKENIADVDFLGNGMVDSFTLMSFIADIESEFDMDISSDMLASDGMRTVSGIAEYIQAKSNAK